MEKGWGRHRGEPFLNKQENVDPPRTHEEHTQHHPIKVPGLPEEDEARAKRTERRDEQRLWVERATFIVGFLGLVGLLFTLQQTRISTEAVTKQLELSERPWISVDLVATRPLVFTEGSKISIWAQFILKNLGHSPARAAQLRFEIVAVSDRRMGYTAQQDLCASAYSVPGSVGIRHVIMPDEQVVQLEHLNYLSPLAEGKDPQIPGRSILSLAVVGCVDYEFTFAEGSHQTGFFFDLVRLDPNEPQLWFFIELKEGGFELKEGGSQIDHVGFKKDAFGSYAY